MNIFYVLLIQLFSFSLQAAVEARMSETDNNNVPLAASSPIVNNNTTCSSENDNAANSNANSSTASVSSAENAPSSGAKIVAPAAKPTGIKLPSTISRIGRPCGNQHKPALPTTPTKSSEFSFVFVVYFFYLYLFIHFWCVFIAQDKCYQRYTN